MIDLKSHKEGEHTIDDELSQKTERLGLGAASAASATAAEAAVTPSAAPAAAEDSERKARPCSTCGGDFSADMALYREHFRSQWHRYNLKRKSKKLPLVSEQEFDELDEDEVKEFFAQLI